MEMEAQTALAREYSVCDSVSEHPPFDALRIRFFFWTTFFFFGILSLKWGDSGVRKTRCKQVVKAREVGPLLSEELGVPVEELRLFIDGDEVDDDYVPMHGDVIVVDPPSISVELPNGSHLELSASPTTTVVDIKQAIHDDTGIDQEDQGTDFCLVRN